MTQSKTGLLERLTSPRTNYGSSLTAWELVRTCDTTHWLNCFIRKSCLVPEQHYSPPGHQHATHLWGCCCLASAACCGLLLGSRGNLGSLSSLESLSGCLGKGAQGTFPKCCLPMDHGLCRVNRPPAMWLLSSVAEYPVTLFSSSRTI